MLPKQFTNLLLTVSQLTKTIPQFLEAKCFHGAAPVLAKERPIRQSRCGGGRKNEFMDPCCKVAIITGGTSGIGLATAAELLCNGAHRVVVCGNKPQEGKEAVSILNAEYGKDKSVYMEADVTNMAQFEDVFKQTLKRFHRLDILCNSAGMLEDKRWELELDVNVGGIIRGCLLALKYMGKNEVCCGRGGIVINNASVVGMEPIPGAPVYGATKHAVIGATRNFGAPYHYNQSGVRVVGLCPGVTIPTETISKADSLQLRFEWGEETRQQINSMPKQPVEVAGQAAMHLIRFAKSGSIWIVEGSKLYKANIPERRTFSECMATYKSPDA